MGNETQEAMPDLWKGIEAGEKAHDRDAKGGRAAEGKSGETNRSIEQKRGGSCTPPLS